MIFPSKTTMFSWWTPDAWWKTTSPTINRSKCQVIRVLIKITWAANQNYWKRLWGRNLWPKGLKLWDLTINNRGKIEFGFIWTNLQTLDLYVFQQISLAGCCSMSPWGLSHCHHTSWATLSLKVLMMAAFMLTLWSTCNSSRIDWIDCFLLLAII